MLERTPGPARLVVFVEDELPNILHSLTVISSGWKQNKSQLTVSTLIHLQLLA